MSERYDLVVIGGGPGGYVAALRAGQLGMRVACVDKRGSPGGTCLHVGCIPSKALLHSSERYAALRHELPEHGIRAAEPELDLAVMMQRKEKVVADLAKGITFLFDKNGVESVVGVARIPEPGRVEVILAGGDTRVLASERILIASGSESAALPGIEVDEKRIVSSTGALSLEHVPERLVVVGGGAIGLELGSVWSRLGAEVQVVEYLDRILPGMDEEIAEQARRILQSQGLGFRLSCELRSAKAGDGGVELEVAPRDGGEVESASADMVLVAVGRRPYTEGLGLDELGVERDEHGYLRVDGRFETSVPGIFAIGDCVPGPMLAHKAEAEGVACVEQMAGQSGHVDHGRVPSVVYTWPEVAGVGATEEALRKRGVDYRVGRFPFSANSRARITGDTKGMVKILADARSDSVLGVHLVGPLAGDLIAEAVLALEFGASAEDIARTCHAHPATGEALKEAALAVAGRALHA